MGRINKRVIKPCLIALGVIVFIVVVNLIDNGIYPQFLKEPLDSLNNFTGGLLFK